MAYDTDIKIKLAQQADKVVNALTIQTNGTTKATYNGSAAATVNITAATIGAAASSHTHNYAGSSSAGGAANSVKTSLIVKLNGGTTEGTNMFTFNGSAAKTINITASSIGASASSHTHTKSQITDFPTSLKNPSALTIQLNGTSQGAYDGSAAKTINITAASIGAATSSHTHSYLPLSGGTLTGQLTVARTLKITAQGASEGGELQLLKGNDAQARDVHIDAIAHRVRFYCGDDGKDYTGFDWDYVDDMFYLNYSGLTVRDGITAANCQVNNVLTVGTNKVRIWGDNEGGNIRVYSPSGSTYYEMDAVQNAFRLYYSNPYKVIFQTDTSGNLNVPTSISTASLTVTSIRCNSSIEMYGPTPFIDFHYNNSTADYTARIIANTSNGLAIYAPGGLSVSNGITCNGSLVTNGEMFSKISGATWHWGPGCGTGNAAIFGLRCQNNGRVFQFGNDGSFSMAGSAVVQTDLIVNGTVYMNSCSTRFSGSGIWLGGYNTTGTPSGPNIRFFGPVHDFYGWTNLTSSSRPCCYITDGSSQAYNNGNVRFARYVSSSRRYKNTITQEFDDTCNPEKLYDLPVVTYHYNKDYDSSDKEGKKLHIGFIAEDVDELFPIACGYEDDGKTPENWNHMELIPGMMKLIQDQHKEILDLQDRVKTLEAQMAEVLSLLSK